MAKNGGQRWNEVRVRGTGIPRKIVFVDERRGWLLATNQTDLRAIPRADVYGTTDGGIRWNKLASLRTNARDLIFLPPTSILMVGLKGWFGRSVDGGRRWERIETCTKMNIESVHLRGRCGVAVGSADLVHSKRSVAILLSQDGGDMAEIGMPDSSCSLWCLSYQLGQRCSCIYSRIISLQD